MKKAISSSKARRSSKAGKTVSAKKSLTKKAAVKKTAAKKPAAKKSAPKKTTKPGKVPVIPKSGSLQARMTAAKKLEAFDRPKAAPKKGSTQAAARFALAEAVTSFHSQRNTDFPNTYISEINVRLEDPNHPVTLTWTGPQAASQETGPFRSSPGAGMRGLSCDNVATSKRSGSNCTPKGSYQVTGFAAQLNSHPEATDVTWFVPARGIALHYYPSVPKYAASHGCVRLELRRVAQLIQSNSRVGHTTVNIDGTWTKPPHQY